MKKTGVSASTLLGIVFVVLKLTNTIAWSWWWVTFPFWGPIALVLLFLAVVVIISLYNQD